MGPGCLQKRHQGLRVRPQIYLFTRKDEPILPQHGSELVHVEGLEAVPATQTLRGQQPEAPLVYSVFQGQHLHMEALPAPGKGASPGDTKVLGVAAKPQQV